MFQTVTIFRSYNLQMDNPHFIDEESEINLPQSKRQKRELFDFDENAAIECMQSQRRLYSSMLYTKQAP